MVPESHNASLERDELIARTLRPARNVVPVLGAGISEGAELPGALLLGQHLLKVGEFVDRRRPSATALFDIVDALVPAWRSACLGEAVAKFVAVEPPTTNPMAQALIDVPSQFIVTLNYDLLVERTAVAAGRPDPRVLVNVPADLREAHRLLVRGPWPPDRLTVLHLHGVVTAPETIVLDSDSYQDLVRNPDVQAVLSELALHRTMLFYGTTLNETYLLATLQAQINRAEHVLVCRSGQEGELTGGRLSISFARHSIRIATVPTFDDLPGHLAQLNLTRDQPATGGARTAGSLPPAGPYIANEFSDRRRPVSDEERIFALLGDDEYDNPAEITEANVAAGHRTLVLGGVGTGKSELLAHLARTSRPDRPGVLIRLGDQKFTGGRPERVLGRWAQTGWSASGDVTVTADAIEGGSMHFLLDGLDEVPSAEQQAAANLVVDLANRLPQHAFTVTSRPVAAASTLIDATIEGRPGWEVLQLEPSSAWQSRYLTHRGVSFEDLMTALPELGDMPEVLTTPFFLSRVVDLYSEGRLTGLKDLGELLAALIDTLLQREEPLLTLDPAEVRAWLHSVALAGLLAGRRSLLAYELDRFPLPDGAAGSPRELAEMLVQRLLLAEHAGVYRFAHRILGEQLAAEALGDREPTAALMDCLVPRRSDAIAAVREDALVTVTLVCLRAADWRRAVAERDPLAVAAATPNDASPQERRQAAELLWGVYTERAIWMRQRGTSALLDHASALGRLIDKDPESEIARRVRAAIHPGEREQQGNAINAWVRSRPKGFVEDLRKVLADHGRDGVVHRQAASAALDGGYTELLDELVQLVETTPDSAVQQGAGLALVQLLPAERRLDLGLRLMRTQEADLVLTRLVAELSPRELILMAAAYEGEDPSWDRRLKRKLAEAIAKVAEDA
ncbi:MAG: SIR2 family protein [Solirubrobacteraceae bacterium]